MRIDDRNGVKSYPLRYVERRFGRIDHECARKNVSIGVEYP